MNRNNLKDRILDTLLLAIVFSVQVNPLIPKHLNLLLSVHTMDQETSADKSCCNHLLMNVLKTILHCYLLMAEVYSGLKESDLIYFRSRSITNPIIDLRRGGILFC